MNRKLRHPQFGAGLEISRTDGYITADFGGTVKSFIWPDAFEHFLKYDDEADQNAAVFALKEKREKQRRTVEKLRAADAEKATRDALRAALRSRQSSKKRIAAGKK